MPLKPQTGASILVRQNDRFLLIKRGKEPYKGHWSLPGGSQEASETLEETARRELKEETDLYAKSLSFTKVRDRITRSTDGSLQFQYVLATYVTTEFTGEPRAQDDADDIGWYTLSEMKDMLTTPETPNFIEEILADIDNKLP